MKRILIFAILCGLFALFLTGCARSNVSPDFIDTSAVNFVLIKENVNVGDMNSYHHSLYYDSTTGVIYMVTYGTYVYSVTPLYNADGTLKIWETYKEVN